MKKMLSMILVLCLVCSFAASAVAEVVTFGSYGYEPITWKVLYSDAKYTKLLSEYVIACLPFDNKNSQWTTSNARKWLNDSFAYQAFSSSERAALMPQNGDHNDLVSLPSLGDVTNPQYGFASNRKAEDISRAAMGNAYAVGDGLWVNRGSYCSYYTMTPCDSESLYQVRTDGSIGVARCDRDNVGIRAMIIVRTDALQ